MLSLNDVEDFLNSKSEYELYGWMLLGLFLIIEPEFDSCEVKKW
jgi:hypothetical protein